MATTTTSTSNFNASVVDAYIRRRILDHGMSNYLFRRLASKDPIPAGEGSSFKFVRYERLVLPGALSEGVAPTADTLDVSTVTGSTTQYGQVVKITDILEHEMWHPVAKHAMEELAESGARKDDAIIQNVLLGATNVQLGGGAASRSALGATDVVDTDLLRDVIGLLEVGSDGVDGGAKPYKNGFFKGVLHRKHELDLLDDTVWNTMATRQMRAGLEKAELGMNWNRVNWEVTNFGPHLKLVDLETPSTFTPNTTDAVYTAAATVNVGVTRTHKKRGFEEDIDDDFTVALGGANTSFSFTAPSDTDYTYALYASDTAAGTGTRKLVAEGLAAASVTQVAALPTGRTIPEAPASAAGTVYTSYVFGADSYSVVDLMNMSTHITRGADSNDPLDQIRTMGIKWKDAAVILNNAFIVRIEAPSQH